MDFSKYLIVTDLDGTFLARGGAHIPQRNLDAVARFTAGGGLFTTATGRLHMTVTRAIPQAAELFSAPAILSNGAYLHDYRTNTHLCEVFFTPEQAAQVLVFIEKHAGDIPCRVSTPYTMRTATPYGLVARDMQFYAREELEVMPSYHAWPLHDWYKIVFRAEPCELAALRAKAEAFFNGDFGIFATGQSLLEIQPVASTKKNGVKKLRELMGGNALTVIACGDYENDIDMLCAADIAVAPANAIPAVKAVADYVLCDCDEGLIADVVAAIEADLLVKRV